MSSGFYEKNMKCQKQARLCCALCTKSVCQFCDIHEFDFLANIWGKIKKDVSKRPFPNSFLLLRWLPFVWPVKPSGMIPIFVV